MRYLILLLLTGCANMTEYVAARHVSNPAIHHDGRDEACVGVKYHNQLSLRLGYCREVHYNEDSVEVELEYELRKRK